MCVDDCSNSHAHVSKDMVSSVLPLWKLFVDPETFTFSHSNWKTAPVRIRIRSVFDEDDAGSVLDGLVSQKAYASPQGFHNIGLEVASLLFPDSDSSLVELLGFHIVSDPAILAQGTDFVDVWFLYATDPSVEIIDMFDVEDSDGLFNPFKDTVLTVVPVCDNRIDVADAGLIEQPFLDAFPASDHEWFHDAFGLDIFGSARELHIFCPLADPMFAAKAFHEGWVMHSELASMKTAFAQPSSDLSTAQNEFRAMTATLLGSVEVDELKDIVETMLELTS